MSTLTQRTLDAAKLGPEAARISRTFDLLVVAILAVVLAAAFHLHAMLLIGDWDFWVDWKDRRWWPTLIPILMITFPAALQNIFWSNLRLPIGATLGITMVMIAEWITRSNGFVGWIYFPWSLVWPATMIGSAIILDMVLMLTGNFLLTAIIGGMAFSLTFSMQNWPLLAPYHLPVEKMGEVVSVADLIGYSYIRTATPEYIRMIERGTLRTFGGHSTAVSAFFSGFMCIFVYLGWWYLGKMLSTVAYLPNRLKHKMGF